MHRFRNIFISIVTLSILGASIVALPAKAVVPEGDTGNWMVSIDSITPTDSSAQVQGTLYDGITPAGANINITTRHITSDSATNVQYGTQTNGVTNNAGKFTITISTLMSGTSYKITATATAPQGTLATSTQETFITNQSNTGNTVQVAYNNPQPPVTARGMVLKFKASNISTQSTATIRLKSAGTVVKTNTAQVIPDATNNALFQTSFTGLTPSTTYDVEVKIGGGSFIGLSPKTTASTSGEQPPTVSALQVSISDVTLTSTTATIEGIVIGDGTTQASIQALASADAVTYTITSPVGYTGAPNATWGAGFTSVFTGLTPSTSYAYKIIDTLSNKTLSSVYYFTTANSTGGVGSTGIDGTWFDLNANYQSARPQTNTCKEDPKKGEYCMLAPIPFPGIINGKLGLTPDTTGNSGVSNFINGIIQFAIAFAGLLAVIMIIIGGITYATVESMSGKTGAKTMITNAIFGLLLALCSYLILKTISPSLVDVNLNIARHEVTVSPNDTSTGSSTSLCISTTNPPNPDTATGSTLTLNNTVTTEYLPARNALNIPTGIKLLITAQTAVEGFSGTTTALGIKTGTKSYRTNNPGNIGNTDDGSIKSYPTLTAGITAQRSIVSNVANNSSESYKIGSKPTCALGNETYDGSLYQYLRIYSTGARQNNIYLNYVIGYFKSNGKNITARTKMSDIYSMN